MITDNLNIDIEELEAESFVPRRKLTSEDDLNTLYEPGIYSFATNNVPSNSPFSNGSIIEVIKIHDTSARIIQRVTRYGVAGQTAERVLYGSEWKEWTTKCSPVSLYASASYSANTANTYYLVRTITIPANCYFVLTARLHYNAARPTGVRICDAENSARAFAYQEQGTSADSNYISATYSGNTSASTKLYVYGRWNAAGANDIEITGFYIPNV